jgi:hypothetical protein
MKFLLIPCLLVSLASGEITQDEIKQLPGWDGPLPSRQFSGYLKVGSKHMHYWLVECEKDPSSAPTVLWLNGGPGCSSLDGLVYEHGPFRINDTDPSRLMRFDHTWAKLANMIYLEAPVGVGFSYSDDKADYNTNDDITAEVNTATMNAFFEAWPEWKKNDFFITGESYAGVYVPTLAEGILWAKGNGTWTGAELKGIAVGNGCTGHEIGSCGGQRTQFDTEYLLGTAFINASLKAQIRSACDWSKEPSHSCQSLVSEMHQIVGHVNLYNIYGECISGSEEQLYGATHSKAPWVGEGQRGPDACINSISGSKWMNQPSVIEASHVKKQPFKWSTCGNQIQYRSTRPNLPRDTYPFLVKHIKVTIYNGDWDACVPYTDNEAWTEGMGYPVKSPWHVWTYDGTQKNQVGGYATTYAANDFTFITVKGGRHEVPETAPLQAFEMLRRIVTLEGFDAEASKSNKVVV